MYFEAGNNFYHFKLILLKTIIRNKLRLIFDKVTTDLRTSIPIAKAAMMRTTPATLATTVATTAQVFTPESSDSSRFRAAVGIKHDVS